MKPAPVSRAQSVVADANPETVVGVKAALVSARELLADPARWCKGTLARAADGTPVDPGNPSATCWCVVGAIHKATLVAAVRRAATSMVEEATGGGDWIADWNDRATHREILAGLDAAIGRAAK